MALSIISIPGDGVTNTFTVSFALGILDRNSTTAWVTGEVDGGGNKVYRNITYLTDTLLTISGAPPGNGIMVVFTRTVSQTALVVNYEDGDIINETNLNTAQKQALMLVHQVLDGRFSAFIQNVSAGGFKITNLGTPTASTDAATKGYVDSVVATGAANAAAAAASAAAALGSQNAAGTSAGTASTQAGIATTQAGLASTYRADSLTYSNNSSASATASQTSRLASETARDKAQEWSDKPEDVFVSGTTEYSAYHWSRKALGYVTGSIGNAIHGATAKTTLVDADEIGVADSAASWVLKRWTFANLKTQIIAMLNTTVDTTPLDADRVWTGDSTASFTPIYSTWTTIKLFLKTYFDTLYGALGTANTWTGAQSFTSAAVGFHSAAGVTSLSVGTGDGASYTTYNTKLHGHFGLGMEDYSSAINGFYDFRLGKWDVKNGYYVNTVRIPFQSQFESAQQTLTAGGTVTVAHGLGVKPKLYLAYLQCTTAQAPWAVGDEVCISGSNTDAGSDARGVFIIPDATNLVVRYGSWSNVVNMFNKTTGANLVITLASWRVVVRAWA